MNLNDLPKLHSFINRKIGMESFLGPRKCLTQQQANMFFDTLTAIRTMNNALKETNLKIENLNDNTLLTVSPLVVDGEYADTTKFYEIAFKENLRKFPENAKVMTRELIHILANSESLPINRIRYHFLRGICRSIFDQYPELPKKIRVNFLTDECQATVIGNRFLFIAHGDTGSPRSPRGHIDLFGFDLKGIIENYINGYDFCNVGFKLPTAISFSSCPSNLRSPDGARVIERIEKPTRHTWVEICGLESTIYEEVTLDFNTVAQNYVNNPLTVLDDARWEAIKQMTKLTGELKSVRRAIPKAKAA